MPLSATQVEKAKPQDKDYKLSDGNGLYLLVKTSGSGYVVVIFGFPSPHRVPNEI